MTYNEFKQELNNLVLRYAQENEASLEIDIKVEKDEAYIPSVSETIMSVKYTSNITTTIK